MVAISVSTNRWMNKDDVVCTHTHTMQCILTIKQNEFATVWMDLKGTTLSEISQTEKGKHGMLSFICGI